jgi:hypothetical protein
LAGNSGLVIWGDSLRGYGVASILLVGFVSCLVGLMARPDSWWRWTFAATTALLAVHALYQSAFLILVMLGVGAGLPAARGNWRLALRFAAIGIPAALSLLIYVQSIQAAQAWWALQKSGFVAEWVLGNLVGCLAAPLSWWGYVWLGLGALALRELWCHWPLKRGFGADIQIFSVLSFLLSPIAFLMFVAWSGLPTQVWYFVPLLVVLAVCLDLALADWVQRHVRWIAGVGLLLLALSFAPALQQVRQRMTNVDLMAAQLATSGESGDLIVISPWYVGVTFARYYEGKTPWRTVPPLADYRMQRFDLLREQMLADHPMSAVLQEIRQVLERGNRLFLVGWYQFPPASSPPPADLPKPPNLATGWNEVPYEDQWGAQVGHLINSHALVVTNLPPSTSAPVSPYENFQVVVAVGFRPLVP